MSERYPGGFITKSTPSVSPFAAPGVWTLDQAMQYVKAGTWPEQIPTGVLYSWGTAGATFSSYGNFMIVTGSQVAQSSPVQLGNLQWSQTFPGIIHVLAIKPDNTLWAWGTNTTGAVGDGTTTNRLSPVQIGTQTYSTASAGASYSVAIRTDGSIYAWGLNSSGQLGLGDTVNYSSPVQIGTLTNWASVSCGSSHTLAIKTDGTLWAWGNAATGRLGNGTTTPNISSPVQIGTLTNWATVIAGLQQGFARKTDGTIWGWGTNTGGQLGDGTTTTRSSPVQIGTLTNWSSIAAYTSGALAINSSGALYAWGNQGANAAAAGFGGGFTDESYSSPVQVAFAPVTTLNILGNDGAKTNQLFIRYDGTLWSWGSNGSGQLGDGTTVAKSFPVQIGTLTNWSKVSCSNSCAAAIKTDGTLWTWGSGNNGALGNNTAATPQSSPIQIGTLTNWSQIAHFFNGVVALKTDGTIWSWGYNTQGQLGLGDTTNRSSPVQIGTLTSWTYVATGNFTVYAIRSNGTLWAWGLNDLGQIGDGTSTDRSSPVQIGTLTNWSKVAGGGSHASAIKTDGTLWTWGAGTAGQLGDGTNNTKSSPVQVGTLTDWSQSAGARIATIALKTNGTIWAFGSNNFGQLGQGDTTTRSSPVQIGTLTDYDQVSAGDANFFFKNTAGQIFAVGNNDNAGPNILLGSGYPTVSAPIQVGSLTNWSTVTAGRLAVPNTFAKRTDGTLWVWGSNTSGSFGNSTSGENTSPVQLGGVNEYNTISTSSSFSMFIKSSGALFAAGATTGLGNVVGNLSSPVIAGQIGQKFRQVAWGNDFAVGVDSSGSLQSWGLNSSGQLGNGTSVNASGPVQVGTLTNWSNAVAYGTNAFAVNNSGQLYGWGSTVAQGIGTGGGSVERAIPVQFGQIQVTNASVGGYVTTGGSNKFMQLISNGALYAIGKNNQGQLGDGTTNDYLQVLAQVGTLTNWSKVSCGEEFSTSVKTDGTLWAWGDNGSGQLGQGNLTSRSSPVQIGTLTNWSSVSAGQLFAVAIKTDGTLWAWGFNTSGQLGDSSTVSKSSPVQIGTLTNWSQASAGQNHCIAVKTDGTLWAWGNGNTGRLGTGSSTTQSSPVQIGTLTTWSKTKQTSYANGSIAIKTDGTAWSWGNNGNGQLGVGDTTNRSSPVQIGTLTNWSDCLMDTFTGYLINNSGQMYSFGASNYAGITATYNLGDGTSVDKSSPVQIGNYTTWSTLQGATWGGIATDNRNLLYTWGANNNVVNLSSVGLSSPVQIGTQSWKSPFIQSDGTLWLWDMSNPIALGIGYTIAEAFATGPVRVGTNTWNSVAKGSDFALAIRSDNTLWGWGVNSSGRLGTSNTTSYSSPIQIGTLSNWSKVAIGASYTLAIKTDGTLWAWGRNAEGQLGDGTTTVRSSPVQIGTLTSWVSVGAIATTSYAVRNDSTLWAWGAASGGRLGNGTTTPSVSSPVQIGTTTTWKFLPLENAYGTGQSNAAALAAS